jgi:hypothetical protein
LKGRSDVPPLKAEKRALAWWKATVAEIDEPTKRGRYCEGNCPLTITVRVGCACAIGRRPKRAENPSRGAATNSIAVETKNWGRWATELYAGDGYSKVVYDTDHVVVIAVLVREGRIGGSCCDSPVGVEGDQNGTTLIGASVLISEIAGSNTPCTTGIAAGDNAARLHLGKRRLRSHHQNEDAENK